MNPKNILIPVIVSGLLIINNAVKAQQNNPLINSGELLKKGEALHDEGKYKEAIEQYKKISRSDTNYFSALYELSLSCYSDSQMNKALEYAKEGLRLVPQDFAKYSMLAANALDDMKKPEDALVVYDSALSKDPQSAILYFNKGVTLFQLKRMDEAKLVLQQGLLINPFHPSSHYFLGNIYLQQGNPVAAMLAYNTYLLLAPNGRYLSKIITLLSSITKVSDDVLEYVKTKKNTTEDNFNFVQQILLSKVALDKKYKLQADLEDNIVRQIQVVDEKLEYKRNDKGFAMQFYVPLYTKIFSEGNFEAMIFTMFSSLKLEKVESWNKKHKKESSEFATMAANYLNEIKSSRVLIEPDRKVAKIMYLYQNGDFIGSGELANNENKNLSGSWKFYYSNGLISSKGRFNEKEEKEGEWTYYYDNGITKEKLNFKENVKIGLAEGWYTNGNKWYTETYVDGKLAGLQTLYFYNGKLKQVVNYKDDKKEGVQKAYKYQGNLVSEAAFANDVQEGITIFYYPGGAKEDEVGYKNNKAEGPYKSYYESGKRKSQGEFADDLKQGEWIIYYENGGIKEKTTYKDNEITGEFTEYHENGKLSRKGNYTKKKIDGKLEDFDEDGKLFSDAIYDRGRLKEINFYDKSGKVIYNTGTRKGAANITFYSPEGIKTGEGYFNRDGNKEGKYVDYFLSGKINEETNFKDGIEDGAHTSYFYNGKKRLENTYVDGKESGYTKEYYFNGKLYFEGWVIDDEKQQQSVFYNPVGDVTTKEYFLNGELDGYSEYYYPGNIHDVDYHYHNGWLQEIIQYDTTGKVMATSTFNKGNGTYLYKHYNGKTQSEGNYQNYMLNGSYKKFYFDGSPRSVFYYKNDKLDSTYVEYFYGGVIKIQGTYKNGDKTGSWKYFYENGKISDEEIHQDGKLNGIDKIYNEDGSQDKSITYKDNNMDGEYKIFAENSQLAVVLNYKYGRIKSYTYEDKTGNRVPPIELPASSGKVSAFFKNGIPSIEINYTDNDIEGQYKLFFTNGKPYVQGQKEFGYYTGLKKIYYSNGNIWKEENYVLGNLHGNAKTYYANGKIKEDENYYNSDYHGLCRYYDEQGKLKQSRVYFYDNLLSVTN